jgi:hypothetical protein
MARSGGGRKPQSADGKKGGSRGGRKGTPAAKKGPAAAAKKGSKAKSPRGKKKEQQKKPLTAEELDQQMMDYHVKKDPKVAAKKLDEDMDSYWKDKKAAEEGAVDDGAQDKKES